jgi:hypothetical protein
MHVLPFYRESAANQREKARAPLAAGPHPDWTGIPLCGRMVYCTTSPLTGELSRLGAITRTVALWNSVAPRQSYFPRNSALRGAYSLAANPSSESPKPGPAPRTGVCGPRGVRTTSARGHPMPAIAEILCQRCGARTEAVMFRGRASVTPCPCGGMRQVVRVGTPSGRRALGQSGAGRTQCSP